MIDPPRCCLNSELFCVAAGYERFCNRQQMNGSINRNVGLRFNSDFDAPCGNRAIEFSGGHDAVILMKKIRHKPLPRTCANRKRFIAWGYYRNTRKLTQVEKHVFLEDAVGNGL